VNAAESASISENREHLCPVRERHRREHRVTLVGTIQQFFALENHRTGRRAENALSAAAVQDEKHIFAFAIDGSNTAALLGGDLRSCLRLRGDGVKT